ARRGGRRDGDGPGGPRGHQPSTLLPSPRPIALHPGEHLTSCAPYEMWHASTEPMTVCLLVRNRHPGRTPLGAAFVPLLVAVLALVAQAAERQMLNTQHVPPAAARLTPVGKLPGSQRLN